MSVLSAGDVLDLWERAEPLSPVQRAVAFAAFAQPGADPTELSALPLGRRDALLLRLRTDLAGPTLDAVASCPSCAERVELSADSGRLLATDRGPTPAVAPVQVDGWVVDWRAPDSDDVAAASQAPDAAAAEDVLLSRCVTRARGPGADNVRPGRLPPAVRAAVAEAMATADPLAEVRVDLSCPACGTRFVAELDVPAFVWAEVRARARRLLLEIDVLARTYGWTQSEVLGLGDARRAAYVRLARGETP